MARPTGPGWRQRPGDRQGGRRQDPGHRPRGRHPAPSRRRQSAARRCRALAAAAGLPRSTIHRIVGRPGRASTSWRGTRGAASPSSSLGLVSLALSRRQRLSDTVRPVLEDAGAPQSARPSTSSCFGARTVVFVDQVIGASAPGRLRHRRGAAGPLHGLRQGAARRAAARRGRAPAAREAQGVHAAHDHRPRRPVRGARRRPARRASPSTTRNRPTASRPSARVIRNAWGEAAAVTIPVPTHGLAGREEELGGALLETCDELDDALGRS